MGGGGGGGGEGGEMYVLTFGGGKCTRTPKKLRGNNIAETLAIPTLLPYFQFGDISYAPSSVTVVLVHAISLT